MATARVNYEYVNLKTFAERAGYTERYARDFLSSPDGIRFKRQRGDKKAIMVNWTLYQEYMETEANPYFKYAPKRKAL